MFGTLWAILTLPFRLVGWAFDLIGRLVGASLGFALMVAGMALTAAGPLAIVGLPLFVVGLVLTLRSLG